MTRTSPIVTMMGLRTGPVSTGRSVTISIRAPKAKAMTRISEEGEPEVPVPVPNGPGDKRHEHRHVALGEVDDAGGAIDEDEG